MIVFGLALLVVIAYFGAIWWAGHRASKLSDQEIVDSMRTNQGRKLPRSPERRKRGW